MTPSPRVWIATFVALVFVMGGLAGVVVDRLWLLPSRGMDRPGLGLGPGRGGPGMGGGQGLGPGGGQGPGSRNGGPAMQNPARVVAELDDQLDLTPDQEASILKILEDWRPRIQELQSTSRQQFMALQEQLQADIARTLTPDQAERLKTMGMRVGGGGGPRGGGRGR